jgi:hypothetical protein
VVSVSAEKTILLRGGHEVNVALISKADDFLSQLLGGAPAKSGLATLQVVKNPAGKPFVAVLIGGKHVGFLSDSDAQALLPTLAECEQNVVVAQASGTVTASPDGTAKPVLKLTLAEPGHLLDTRQVMTQPPMVEAPTVQLVAAVQPVQPMQTYQPTAAAVSVAAPELPEQGGAELPRSPEAAVFCRNCGTKNPEASRFCNSCGFSLEAISSVVSQPSETVSTSRPGGPGQNAGPGSLSHSEASRVTPHLRTVASAQKLVINAILLYFVAVGLSVVITSTIGAPAWANVLVSLLSIATLVMSVLGMLRLGQALGKSNYERILYVVLMLLPLIGLIGLLWLNSRATSMLRDAGLKVGLLGVRSQRGREAGREKQADA